MQRLFYSSFISLITVLACCMLVIGCSGGSDPSVPDQEYGSDPNNTERVLWGIYTLAFDLEANSVQVIPERELEAHYNVTSMLTNPLICPGLNCLVVQVTGQQPGMLITASVTLRNPTFQTAYDVRGIMVNNSAHYLTNPDNYTALWFGSPNPFKAFAKSALNRKMIPASVYTENYEVKFNGPPYSFNVQYAVDVSWPGNCKDPYWIKDIETEGTMTAKRGCAYVSLKCYDWNGPDDVESVEIDTMPFNGGSTSLEHTPGTYEWSGLILNSFQATTGTYDCLISASSPDSNHMLYDYVTIDVNPPIIDLPYQGTVTDAINVVPVDDATLTTSDGQEFYTTNTDKCGTYVLENVPMGKRVISVAKPYFETMHNVTLYEGTTVLLDVALTPTTDVPPLQPTVTISDPVVDFGLGQAVVTGIVENIYNPTAIMCLNYEEYLIDVDPVTGEYMYICILVPGMNYIRVRATNATGSEFSEEKTVDFSSAEYPFKVVLTWDTVTDQDNHGWDPNFDHCYYINDDIPTMSLDIDVISDGYGPETITGTAVIPGRYCFAVNYFSEHDDTGPTICTVDVLVNPNTAYYDNQTFQHTLTLENFNGDYPVTGDTESWWRVCDIVIDNNLICTIEPPDTTIVLNE